jgi:sialate O-acetylesterase
MRSSLFFAIAMLSFGAGTGTAQVRLPQLISNGMVLQRDTKLNLWGWASPGEKITIKFNHQTVKAMADAAGIWKTVLKPMPAGGPYTMDISASNHIMLNDVMIGDVWFCSGQSNMVLNMERVKEKYPQDIATANYPAIRNFFVPTLSNVSKIHNDLPPGKWISATPKTVLNFGAVSYFFARDLYLKYKVPIGIINSSVGGTPIQAWISADGIKDITKYAHRLNQLKDTTYLNSLIHPAVIPVPNPTEDKKWDKGLNCDIKWYDNAYQPKNWHQFWLPGYWDDQGVKNLNGVVWFRKEIDVPAQMAGKPAKLYMAG